MVERVSTSIAITSVVAMRSELENSSLNERHAEAQKPRPSMAIMM